MTVNGNAGIWPFGTEGSVNTVPDSEDNGDIQNRFYSSRFEIVADSHNKVCSLTTDRHYKYQKDKDAKEIATLGSVIAYLDSRIADNMSITVDTITFCYAADHVDGYVYPVWVFEFRDKDQNRICENRMIVNAVNGRVCCLINGYYNEI